jgi:cytochrome b561
VAGINRHAKTFPSARTEIKGDVPCSRTFSIDQPNEREPHIRGPALYGAPADATPIGTRRRPFDSVTIGLHWATALLVLAMFGSAWLHSLAEAHESVHAAALIQIHRSLGATIWIVTGLRLAWRLTNAELPPFPVDMTTFHRAIVKLSECTLYALLLAQPATGLSVVLFNGRAFTLFLWRIPQLLPQDKAISAAFHSAHEFGAWALGALAAGHASAALFHHFVLRDDVLQCMAPVIKEGDSKRAFPFRHVINAKSIEAQ